MIDPRVSSKDIRVAADIGGTFTDVVAERGRERTSIKVLTTNDQPEAALLVGVDKALASFSESYASIATFVHGTTLATNAIIERSGARTALISTEGFRDVIEIADEGRYDQYDLFIERPVPLVPRPLRLTVPERVDVTGTILLDLDENAVRACARRLSDDGVESVAVAYLHAYANPAHELRTRDILAEVAPALSVSLSSEICPEIREYERTSTTVANAFVQPLMAGYLTRLDAALAERGCTAPLRLITSGGHLTSVEAACRHPVRLVESGPAGGAILAAHVARARGEDRVLSFDMGGTTAKICLIEDGAPMSSRTFEVDRAARFLKGSGLPLRIPVIEMIEIGAGGGSIAGLDATKSIVVGPRSAGSEPGPACYARGGDAPTVTDSDVALGRISPDHFAGGTIRLDAALSYDALKQKIAEPLNLPEDMAAFGVSEIVDENMANAARVHAAERGVTLGSHTLIAFGGAAPLHAARLAEKLGLARVIVPQDAGVGSAVGFLRAPVAFELVRSLFIRLDALDADRVNALLVDMAREARALVGAADGLRETRQVFMRYSGQGHEVSVSLPAGPLGAGHANALRAAFEAEYRRQFARHIPGAAIEALSWIVTVDVAQSATDTVPYAANASSPNAIDTRDIFDPDTQTRAQVPIYARHDIALGGCLSGPALIVEDATSTYVTAQFDARVDGGGALILERRKDTP